MTTNQAYSLRICLISLFLLTLAVSKRNVDVRAVVFTAGMFLFGIAAFCLSATDKGAPDEH